MDHGILIAGWTDLSSWISFLKAALGLGLVIFVHELGHFLLAKACGVKCEKFYVGFDPPMKIGPIKLPRALFRKQWGETEYGIGIIPLGGYVKMLGQDDNPANASKEAERIKIGAGEGAHESDALPELDPRSYPAKSVPQRMLIISAGVIFNLIFGVIFATIAYKMGVSYTPCLIGATIVGDPAWQANLQPGDRIIQLGRNAKESEQLRFNLDLKLKMFSLNKDQDVEFQVMTSAGEKRWVTLSPSTKQKKQVGTPTIGVYPARDTQVAAVFDNTVAKEAGLLAGDRIEAITVDGKTTSIQDGLSLEAMLAQYRTEPITLTIARQDQETKTQETIELQLPVAHAKRFGVILEMGPIAAVQTGSLAEQAGLRVGDVLQAINGEPIQDPLTLATDMLAYVGTSTTLTVKRGEETQKINIIPAAPRMTTTVHSRDGLLGLETIGVGYRLLPLVKNVIPGSPADNAGILSGDVLQSVLLVPRDPTRAIRKLLELQDLDKPIPVDAANNNWPWVYTAIQEPTIQFEIDLVLERDGQAQKLRLAPERSNSVFDPDRGLLLKLAREIRVAPSLGEAFALGQRETWDGMKQVFLVLRKIKDSYKKLGGPLMIAAVGTMEASEGLPRLLVFLTMLSANLAILNFLPIPVLDGGHMVFLTYEGIFGKPVNERIAFGLTIVGFGLLMGLMVFVFGLDINRFLG